MSIGVNSHGGAAQLSVNDELPPRPAPLDTVPVPAGLLQHLQLNSIGLHYWQQQQQQHVDATLQRQLYQQQQFGRDQVAGQDFNQHGQQQLQAQQQHELPPQSPQLIPHQQQRSASLVPLGSRAVFKHQQHHGEHQKQADSAAGASSARAGVRARQPRIGGEEGPRQLKTYTGKKPVLSVVVQAGMTIYERVGEVNWADTGT